MKNWNHALSLFGYLALSWAYFVEKNLLVALAIWIGFVLLKYLVNPMRQQLPLLLLVGVCFSFLTLIHQFLGMLTWPLDFYLIAIVGFLVLKFIIKQPSEKLNWTWRFSRKEILSVFIINIPSIAILYWYFQVNPDVAKQWPMFHLPVWAMILAVLGIAAVNGLREEIFYRGLIQGADKNSPFWFSIGLQAILFGFLHFSNAFPQGWVGVAMTATWGAAIAVQYHLFKKISLVWLTHAMADAVMFTVILNSR